MAIPFDHSSMCDKCGASHPKKKYVAARDYVYYFMGRELAPHPEYLFYTCNTCGYTWNTDVLLVDDEETT